MDIMGGWKRVFVVQDVICTTFLMQQYPLVCWGRSICILLHGNMSIAVHNFYAA